jgi:hypothetical protein
MNMATKKTKTASPANDTELAGPFLASTWQHLYELADDTRAELHRQTGALITVVDGALRGATGFASNLNDRADQLAKEGLLAAATSGRQLASAGQRRFQELLRSSRTSAAQVVTSTRESARDVSARANATVHAIVTPAKAA